MKAVVLEVKGDYVVVMKDDGTIEKMKNDNYFIGGIIEMKEKKVSLRTKLSTLVAAMLIFAMVGTGTWANASKGYDVRVEGEDENEIVIEVNRLKGILSIEFGKYSGELDEDDLEGMDIMEALEIILEELEIDSKNVFVTTVAKDEAKAEELATQIRERIQENEDKDSELAKEEKEKKEVKEENDDKEIKELKEEKEYKVITNGMGYEMVQAARALEITPGKYNLITKYLEVNPKDGDIRDYIEMSNQEIMQLYSSQKGEKNGWVLDDDDDVLINRGQAKDKDKDQDKDQDQDKDKDKDQEQIRDQKQIGDLDIDKVEDDEDEDSDDDDDDDEDEDDIEEDEAEENNGKSNGNGNSNRN